MSRSGNQPGYKVFSISTTIRNPKRNTEFLEVLKLFDDMDLSVVVKDKIYTEIIRRGIYRFSKLDNVIKEKYEAGIDLTDDEINRIILNNPQKTGDEGRIMTQIRAIKDSGFLSLTGNRNKKHMKISPLGNQLLEGYDVENVYTKAMIGLHSNNPQRDTIYNHARPFLNTLFVINEINKHYGSNKGILWHEFAVFVLSMKDCNYKSVAEEIIKYREKNKNKMVKLDLEKYLYEVVKVNRVEFGSILKDYADDVFRKFDMTGLFTKSGFRENTYLRFNDYNITKVNSILKMYSDYKFETFRDTDSYMNYLSEIKLPWEENEEVKKEIITQQVEELGVAIDTNNSLDEQMKELASIYNKRLFDSSVNKYDINLIKEELKILSRNSNEKSKFDSIPEPVRLEWLIALVTAKIYGSQYIKPNLSLDSEGIPKSHAAGGMADIEFISDELYCLIEVTMMKDYRQQENSETTSISDHLRNLNVSQDKCSLLLAPIIHNRVIDYFRYCIFSSKLDILALTIELYVDVIEKNSSIAEFKKAVHVLVQKMTELEIKDYADMINNFRLV